MESTINHGLHCLPTRPSVGKFDCESTRRAHTFQEYLRRVLLVTCRLEFLICYSFPTSQLIAMPPPLEDVRINSIPSSAYYIADFITQEEERVLLKKVSTVFCDKAFAVCIVDLERLKPLQNLGGNSCHTADYKRGPLI